jgi:hypothetical protein
VIWGACISSLLSRVSTSISVTAFFRFSSMPREEPLFGVAIFGSFCPLSGRFLYRVPISYHSFKQKSSIFVKQFFFL